MPSPPRYKVGDKIATRKAYGLALAKLGHSSDRIIALDGETKNPTFSKLFRKVHPERFIKCCIAEQNMMSVAVGCATRDRTVPFCSTFAAFFTRAFDQIRMAAISESNINLCGSHCGVSIGELRPGAGAGYLSCLEPVNVGGHVGPREPIISFFSTLQGKTGPRRWPWKTWPCFGRSLCPPSFTQVMELPQRRQWN